MSPELDSVQVASAYRLTAINFKMAAQSLADSFEERGESLPGNIRAIPFYYLMSHAIELLLKVAIVKRGVGPAELKNRCLGHNLINLLDALEEVGGMVTGKNRNVIEKLSAQHANHRLRYDALLDPEGLTYTPEPSSLFKLFDELLLAGRVQNNC